MYKGFPCSDYYGSSVAIWVAPLRQSPFRHIITIWHDRLSDTTFVLYYVCSCSVISSFAQTTYKAKLGITA